MVVRSVMRYVTSAPHYSSIGRKRSCMELTLRGSVNGSTVEEFTLPSYSMGLLQDVFPAVTRICKTSLGALPSDVNSFLQRLTMSLSKPTTLRLSSESSHSWLEIVISETSSTEENETSSMNLPRSSIREQ